MTAPAASVQEGERPAGLSVLLLVSVFAIATCGLVYELIAGTAASYLLGDSVTQFSTVIGVYLSAMGLGSWLSARIERDLLLVFVRTEILVGLVGGFSAAALFLLFGQVAAFRVPLYSIVAVIGVLVGVEIPLLLRILRDEYSFKDLVARVLAFDYVGALFASLLFPLVLVPHLGLIRSSFLFGIVNVTVALWLLYALDTGLRWVRVHRGVALASLAALVAGFVYADRITDMSEAGVYSDAVIHAQSTPYQRIVLTSSRRDTKLYLNGNLQFSSRDEYRYHEALVHPGLTAVEAPRRVLIFGGGDGLAAREVLRVPSVERITQVELDPAMVRLFSDPQMAALNAGAYASPKLHVTAADAFVWLKQQAERPDRELYDFVVVDFPDPSNFSIGKLYTSTFFRLLRTVLAPGGAVVVQSTSPFVARKSFWCVVGTLEAAGFATLPYHAWVPSFGEWGFVLASPGAPPVPRDRYPPGLRYVSAPQMEVMRHFPADMDRVPTEVNRLDSQALVRYFDAEWGEYGVN